MLKNYKKAVLISLGLLFVFTAISAVVLTVFVPGDSWQKILTTGIFLILSLLPLIIAVIMIRSMNAFAAQVEQFNTRDPLTNLYNQKTFWDFLGYEIARSRRHQHRFALMIADLDNFKTINDVYGHEAADTCLRELSKLFKLSVRKEDIAARYGGDEFAAILPICDEVQSKIAAKRFLETLRNHSFVLPNGTKIEITASIGMAVYPDHASDVENLFLVAHTMLGQAKASGKDRMRLPSDEVSIESLKSAGESYIFIMDAIRKKQIVPYFQPIVSTNDHSVLAYEVLTRIVTPDRIIPAAEFIEAAEDIGAIGKIDYQLMEQAFTMMKGSGYEGMLFFNLSPKALVINEFMPTMRRLLNRYGINPELMVFEITERDTVKNLNLIERTIRDLRLEGFRFAIDDFGKGYSSFEYVKSFKVDFLKIDGDFIRNMNSDSGIDRLIVKNAVDLAALLGIKTIAEYVESETVLGFVKSAGIDLAQGYHIARPMPDLNLSPSFLPGGDSVLLAG